MNRGEAVFSGAEIMAMKQYAMTEKEILELRTYREQTQAERYREDLDKIDVIASGIEIKTWETMAKEEGYSSQDIYGVKNWRETKRVQQFKEDQKMMIMESKPLLNAAKKAGKGIAIGIGYLLANAATSEMQRRYSSNLKEGVSQGFKLGINILKETRG